DAPERPSSTLVITRSGETTTPRAMTTVSWVTGGVAVGALGGAILLGLSTRSAYQRCDHIDMPCSDDDIASVHHRAIAADVFTAIAIAAGAATAVMYARWGGETIGVTPTAGGAAVTFGGRF